MGVDSIGRFIQEKGSPNFAVSLSGKAKAIHVASSGISQPAKPDLL